MLHWKLGGSFSTHWCLFLSFLLQLSSYDCYYLLFFVVYYFLKLFAHNMSMHPIIDFYKSAKVSKFFQSYIRLNFKLNTPLVLSLNQIIITCGNLSTLNRLLNCFEIKKKITTFFLLLYSQVFVCHRFNWTYNHLLHWITILRDFSLYFSTSLFY